MPIITKQLGNWPSRFHLSKRLKELSNEAKLRINEKKKLHRDKWAIEDRKITGATYHPSVAVSYKSFIPLTAQLTELPEDLVQHILTHTFGEVKNWINDPAYKSCLTVPGLGTFTLNKYGIYKTINRVIQNIKRAKEEEPELYVILKEYLSYLWQLKQLVNQYEKENLPKYNPSLLNKRKTVQVLKKGLTIKLLEDPFKKED